MPSVSLSVDDAQLDRAIGTTQPADGHIFVDVGITLANVAETTPLPAAFTWYTLTTASLLVYPVSPLSAGLSPSCGNFAIAAGGHTSCRIAFDIPATEVPVRVEYATATGLHVAADITTVAPLSCAAPGLRCDSGSDCCTGVCQATPTRRTCSLRRVPATGSELQTGSSMLQWRLLRGRVHC